MSHDLRIGMLGYGGIGRVHALCYGQLPFAYPGKIRPVLQSVCTSSQQTAESAQNEGGFVTATTSSEELVANPEVDVVDITLPNHLHESAVRLALDAGKPVYCEKPLSGSIEDARRIANAVAASDVTFGMVFQYRFIPALQRAKELIDSGALGRVYTYRAEYLHSGYQDATRPLSWRMKKEEGGSGALGDLGSHVIDLVRFLVGEFGSVQGHLERFIEKRPVAAGASELGPVTVDDVAFIRARMEDGSIGTIEASRFATGTLDDLRLWIYGENGAIRFDLMDANFLYVFDQSRAGGAYGGDRGWQRIDSVASFPGAKAPPARAPLGWARAHAESQYRFLSSLKDGSEPAPGIRDGLRAQLAIDAVERSAASGGIWTDVATE